MNLPLLLYLVKSFIYTYGYPPTYECLVLEITHLCLWFTISCFHYWTQLIVNSSGEVTFTSSRLIWRSQIKHLETLLFCLFYICYTRSLLPLSPGSGFTYFLLTATQPRLRTGNLDFLNLILTTLQARGSVIWLFWGTPAFQQEEPASNSQE